MSMRSARGPAYSASAPPSATSPSVSARRTARHDLAGGRRCRSAEDPLDGLGMASADDLSERPGHPLGHLVAVSRRDRRREQRGPRQPARGVPRPLGPSERARDHRGAGTGRRELGRRVQPERSARPAAVDVHSVGRRVQEEEVAPGPAERRVDDPLRERGGERGVDRGAAGREGVDAGLGRERVPGRRAGAAADRRPAGSSPLAEAHDVAMAAAAASAATRSCSGSPPLAPIAPSTSPSRMIGTAPLPTM